MNDRALEWLDDDQPYAGGKRDPSSEEKVLAYAFLKLDLLKAAIGEKLEMDDFADSDLGATYRVQIDALARGQAAMDVVQAWEAMGKPQHMLARLDEISKQAMLIEDRLDRAKVAGMAKDIREAAKRRREGGDDDSSEHATEIELARRFARECSDRFRYSHGMEWMVNCISHWQRDDRLIRFNEAKAICRQAADQVDKPSTKSKLASASTVAAVLNLARSEREINVGVDEWDQGEMLLNTPGECYDLATGEVTSRDGRLFTQVTSVAPDFEMPTPLWTKFLLDTFDHDEQQIAFMQRLMGYCLTGSVREQKMFFFYGTGGNGKSVLLDAFLDIMGRYSHSLPTEALMTSKHQQHPTIYADLQGKRLAVSSEVGTGQHWDEARIKSLTGEAKITARYMRSDNFTFSTSHKHLISGNHRPRLRGDDEAMVRRVVLVPFTQSFVGDRRDNSLREKLKAEYPGILAWAIKGSSAWWRDGLQIPVSVDEASQAYLQEQDDIRNWRDECCVVAPGLRRSLKDLYRSFRGWKLASGEYAGSNKDFAQRLEKLQRGGKSKTKEGVVFDGLDLKASDPSLDNSSNYDRFSNGY